jgi:hypothetical protein
MHRTRRRIAKTENPISAQAAAFTSMWAFLPMDAPPAVDRVNTNDPAAGLTAATALAIARFEPTTPHPRIAAAMKASNHDDTLWIDSI